MPGSGGIGAGERNSVPPSRTSTDRGVRTTTSFHLLLNDVYPGNFTEFRHWIQARRNRGVERLTETGRVPVPAPSNCIRLESYFDGRRGRRVQLANIRAHSRESNRGCRSTWCSSRAWRACSTIFPEIRRPTFQHWVPCCWLPPASPQGWRFNLSYQGRLPKGVFGQDWLCTLSGSLAGAARTPVQHATCTEVLLDTAMRHFPGMCPARSARTTSYLNSMSPFQTMVPRGQRTRMLETNSPVRVR